MNTPDGHPRVATAVSTAIGSADTGRILADRVTTTLDERPVDLCILLASAHYEDEFERLVTSVSDQLKPRAFIGTTAEAVIEGEFEHEGQPAVALWAAHLPGAHARAFHLAATDVTGFASGADLAEYIGLDPQVRPSFVLLADPFTFGSGVLKLLDQLGEAYLGRPVLGGIASAGDRAGQNRLVFDGHVLRSGAVGAALWGNVVLDTVVSQGCRPIGKRLEVTKAEAHIIQELGGRSPLKVLMEVLRECRPGDVELARTRGLLVGRQLDEPGPDGHEAFLIRTPVGFDQDTGALAVNDHIAPGQTIRFHVRDDASAEAELTELLEHQHATPAAGALMFTCNGRGTRLFAHKHHDARAVAVACDALPLAGFFAAGEIGPVGARNFLHGHTACIGFLRAASGPARAS